MKKLLFFLLLITSALQGLGEKNLSPTQFLAQEKLHRLTIFQHVSYFDLCTPAIHDLISWIPRFYLQGKYPQRYRLLTGVPVLNQIKQEHLYSAATEGVVALFCTTVGLRQEKVLTMLFIAAFIRSLAVSLSIPAVSKIIRPLVNKILPYIHCSYPGLFAQFSGYLCRVLYDIIFARHVANCLRTSINYWNPKHW